FRNKCMVKNNKKAQGLSINVIIIAALALIVLVVLIVIFTGQTRKTISTLESCGGIAGSCREKSSGCLSGEVEKSDAKCQGTQVCCIRIFNEKK
ncbi:hypothetical protein J4209_07130, partial [Candidatus Woesearchaeota archaeon]|nr:hypothetical protein [Candidatus Woesearchaeota archaeon]